MAVIDVGELTVKLAALVEPNLTVVVPLKPVPVIVTVPPPLGEPWLGSTRVTVGPYVKRSASLVALVPPAVVTVTSTVPVPAGETAVIEVPEFTVTFAALVEPNLTTLSPVK